MRIISDSPITDIEQDRFGREPIVDLVVESINKMTATDHPCVVYGIYGKWGEGKTSLMHFIKNKLKSQGKEDGINLVEFNPWLVNNDEALLREFFKAITTDMEEEARTIFKKYGSLAIFAAKTIINAFAPGIGTFAAEVVQGAKDALIDSEDTLIKLKEKASKAIVNSKRHLVVMIDDVDRLDKEELHSVLRLVRQVADFENVIYIVAMDVEMVSKAIAQYYGGGENFDGRRYIDKIVQIPITIPPVPKERFVNLVQEELKVELKDYTSEEEVLHICELVTPLLLTRRELLRYCNQLAFVLPGLKDEVNISDICVLEAIKSISIEAYRYIYNNRSAFFRELDGVMALMDKSKEMQEAQKRYDIALEEAVSELESHRRKTVADTIDKLFNSNHVLDEQAALDEKRIYTSTYFSKYFTQLVPDSIISDTELNNSMASLSDRSDDEIAKWISSKNERYDFSEVRRALLYFVQHQQSYEEKRKLASKLAVAVSVSLVGHNSPYHIEAADSWSSFVGIRLLQKYFAEQDPVYAGLVVQDVDLLNSTLSTIFERAELNFSLNLLTSVNNFYKPKDYDLKEPILKLAEQFKEVSIEEQMRRSKYLLQVLFDNWKTVDAVSFNEYATILLGKDGFPLVRLLKRFIDGTDDVNDINTFVYLFEDQIGLVLKRAKDLTIKDKSEQVVRVFFANYRVSLDNMRDRKMESKNY